MASAAGTWPFQKLAAAQAVFPQHNVQTSTPGLPVKAANKIFQGVLVAYDPANSQAEYADPAMPATSRVIGVNTGDTVDNTNGAKGDLKVSPEAGIFRLANDGNVTAAHLYAPVRVIDDHTVGVPAGTGADRTAGIAIGLEGTGYVWVLVSPEINVAMAPMNQKRRVIVDADGATLTAGDTGAIISNAGASGAAVFALPAATPGLEFYFLLEAAQELRIDPSGTETIALPSSGVQGAAGKYLSADAVREHVHLICLTAGTWDVLDYSGTWTAEA
jgi:hypothetical protein